MKEKTRNYLKNNKWYHATTLDCWENICELGIIAEYNKETSKDLDFGYGFYLTNTQEKAEEYINRLINSKLVNENQAVIIEFEFIPLRLV